MLYNNFLLQDLKITSKIDNPVGVFTVGPKLTQPAQGNGDVHMTFKNAFFFINVIFPITGKHFEMFYCVVSHCNMIHTHALGLVLRNFFLWHTPGR